MRNLAERVAMAHVSSLHRNGWLEDTSIMEDGQEPLESDVLSHMVLVDEELMVRNTHLSLWRYMDTR